MYRYCELLISKVYNLSRAHWQSCSLLDTTDISVSIPRALLVVSPSISVLDSLCCFFHQVGILAFSYIQNFPHFVCQPFFFTDLWLSQLRRTDFRCLRSTFLAISLCILVFAESFVLAPFIRRSHTLCRSCPALCAFHPTALRMIRGWSLSRCNPSLNISVTVENKSIVPKHLNHLWIKHAHYA